MSIIRQKCCTVLSLLMGVSLSVTAQKMDLEWVTPVSGAGGTIITSSMTLDKEENVYAVGCFNDSIEVPTKGGVQKIKAVRSNTSSMFVMKTDATGVIEWIKGIGGEMAMGAAGTGDINYNDWFSIVSDKNDNLYISGCFRGTVDFDPGPNQALKTAQGQFPGEANSFILKLDKEGVFGWVKTFHGGINTVYDMAIDQETGTICVTGFFGGKVEFNNGSGSMAFTAVNLSRSIFIAKYDTSGNFTWARRIGNQSERAGTSNQGRGIHIDEKGYVYVIGIFQDSADFDPGPGFAPMVSYTQSSRSIFILKYDSSGNYVWAKAYGGTQLNSPADGYRVTTDNKGNIYMTGFFQHEANFDPVNFAAKNPATNIAAGASGLSWYVSKLDANGTYLWAKVFGRASFPLQIDNGLSLQVNKRGDIYASGYFSGNIYLDPNSANSSRELFRAGGPGYSPEGFVIKLNTDGNLVWARQFKSAVAPGNSVAASISRCLRLSATNSLYVSGYFMGTADFDPSGTPHKLNTMNPSGRDGYILKFSCNDTSSSVIIVETCASHYEFLGETYTESGDYEANLVNESGCDSTILLQLTMDPPEAIISVNEFELSTGQFKTYQWLFEGELIPGATSRTYTVSKNGRYQVVVLSERGCIDTSEIYLVTNVHPDPSGIYGKVLANDVNIYPNPSDDIVHISAPTPLTILLTGVEGRPLIRKEYVRQITIGHLPSGIYLLKVADEKGNLIKIEKVIRK